MKAIVVGASGLIGNSLMQILLVEKEYSEVVVFVRKQLAISHKKLIQVEADFNQLSKYANQINGNAIFCCLGSTNQKAPNKDVYRMVDHDYPLQLAEIAKANKIPQYHLVSAATANASSRVFYSKLKGETENDIINVGLPSLHIYQPMLLTGERKEYRTGEKIAIGIFKILDTLLVGPLKKYRSISGETVAKTMFKQSLIAEMGTFIYPSKKIQELS